MFDSLASFTPNQAVTPTTNVKDVAGIGNLITGGEVKHNRELEKLFLQANLAHKNNMELNKWNALWNKELQDTQIQRRFKDMEKAGINPILAHGQTLSNSPSVSGASAGSSGIKSDSSTSNKVGKLVKTLAMLVLKSF